MGCGESRPSTPFREKNTLSWVVNNAQWKTFVESTYSQEFIQESGAKIDTYKLWKDMNETEVGSRYVVGRSVHAGKDFVSFGRILVQKDYWHSYEGTWVSDDIYFGSGRKEEFKIEPGAGQELTCKATGENAQQDTMGGAASAFQGQGRRLGDEAPPAKTGGLKDDLKGNKPEPFQGQGQKLSDDVPEPEKPKEPAAADAEGGEAEETTKIVWKRESDGKVLVRNGQGQMVEGELKLTSYEEITVIVDGNAVGTFKREIPKELEHRKFDGTDWVFGDETDAGAVRSEKCASFMTLHLARVDEQKKVLQVVVSLGRKEPPTGQPSSLTVPIPVNKIGEMKRYCDDYRKYLKPLYFQGRWYMNDDEMFKFMATWMLVDVAVTLCCFAIMSSMMADSAMYGAEAGAFGAADAGEGMGFSLFDFF